MSTRVPIYRPDVRVTLYKTTGRKTLDGGTPVSQRVIDVNKAIDLTPFLGEYGSMRVSKSVHEPAGGFALVLADKPLVQPGAFESLYGLIEPMDFVEIRIRHNPPSTSSNPSKPPVYMRGFVSEVQRQEAMGADGRPQRSVTISGQDWGKIWQLLQVLFTPAFVVGENILSSFKLFERFGVGFQTTQTASDFVTQVVQKVINPFIWSLMPENSPNPAALSLDISVANGVVDVGGTQNHEGTIYSILRTYCDVGPWNELFIEDREDGVYCVYRPNPYKDVTGAIIQPDAPYLTPIDVPASDVISLNVSRTDANVANYYWVRAPRFELVDDVYRQQFALQKADEPSVVLAQYPNAAERFYGMRPMRYDTQMGGNDVATFNSGQPANLQATRNASMANWINNRRAIMVAQNKDNVLFESGTMRIRANELIKAGCYVRLVRGSFTATYYVPKVDVDYIPYQGLFMTLTLERGAGFIERVTRGGGAQSPYLAEMTAVGGAA